MGTIISMRRIALVIVLVLVVGGVAWAIWPATTWPRAFCAPVVRVVGTDARTIVVDTGGSGWKLAPASIPGAQAAVARLRADIELAKANAPTSQLRKELGVYFARLRNDQTMLPVTSAMSQFDSQSHTQLEACGVKPIGS